MTYCNVAVGCSSSHVISGALQVEGQHRFRLLLFTVCSNGYNSGLGWAYSLM
jgi:hypothetical protein